ncbi:hypothetical protein C8R45DRAFT_933128 [Mycena sanguinolenta]|nr:hypothetical protein C8R45DRAFT_933128 [Mycena sanguinolenta]
MVCRQPKMRVDLKSVRRQHGSRRGSSSSSEEEDKEEDEEDEEGEEEELLKSEESMSPKSELSSKKLSSSKSSSSREGGGGQKTSNVRHVRVLSMAGDAPSTRSIAGYCLQQVGCLSMTGIEVHHGKLPRTITIVSVLAEELSFHSLLQCKEISSGIEVSDLDLLWIWSAIYGPQALFPCHMSSRALWMTTAILTGTEKHYNPSALTCLMPNNAPVAKQIYSKLAGMWERTCYQTLLVIGREDGCHQGHQGLMDTILVLLGDSWKRFTKINAQLAGPS